MQALITSPAKRLPSTLISLRSTRPSPERLFVPSTIHFSPVCQRKASSYITDDPFVDATEESQTRSALPLGKSSQINLSRRIEFTGFSLVENSMARSPRNDEEWLALSAAFPGAIGIQVNAIMIVVRYAAATLPNKPWPLSAGGLPVYITTDLTTSGFNRGRKGGNSKGLDNYDVKDGLSEDLFQCAISYYKNEHGINVTSILHLCGWSDCLTMSRLSPYPVC